MSKQIIGLEWAVVDRFIEFPPEQLETMLQPHDGGPKLHFHSLPTSVLQRYYGRYPGLAIAGGTMVNMLANVAALGGATGLIAVTGPDPIGDVARRNLARRNIAQLVPTQVDAISPAIYVCRQPDGDVLYNVAPGTSRAGLTADMLLEAVPDPANSIIATQINFMTHRDIAPEVSEALAGLRARGAQLAIGLQCVERDGINRTHPYADSLLKPDYMFGNAAEYAAWRAVAPAALNGSLLNDLSCETGAVYIMTKGSNGIEAFDNKAHVMQAAAPIDEIVCTVGAGDAVMGGVLYALSQEKSIPQALKLAALCAREALMHEGGQPSRTEPGHLRHLPDAKL